MTENTPVTIDGGYRLPSNSTLQHAVKLSVIEDKPIMMDYWTTSIDKKSIIGISGTNVRYLMRSEEEYTSSICKFYQVGNEFIVATENSLYIIDHNILRKKIIASKDKLKIL